MRDLWEMVDILGRSDLVRRCSANLFFSSPCCSVVKAHRLCTLTVFLVGSSFVLLRVVRALVVCAGTGLVPGRVYSRGPIAQLVRAHP